jgi:hypothetical protein
VSVRVTTPPWVCQLVHVDEIDGGLGLDLIALDACPIPNVELPPGMPFVIRVVERRAVECADLVKQWADGGTVITIRLVDMTSGRWLCLSGHDRHLLLEMTV